MNSLPIHLLPHAPLCFWDTAKGLTKMRQIMEKETGQMFSLREYSVKLKAKGIVGINEQTIQLSEYAVRYLGGLGEWKKHLVAAQVQRIYRPQMTALQELWKLHRVGNDDQFKQLSNSAIEGCVTAGVARGEQYKPEAVVYAVTHAIATSLGYPVAGLERAVRIHRVNPIKSLSGLRSILERDPSEAHFYEVLFKFGKQGGVSELITEVPASALLPYGYYMEMPQKVLGTSTDDVSVMTWWFLASFAGQLVMDETLDHLCGTNGKEAILEDLGPGCLRHALIDTNIWRSSVLANLVGFPDTSWLTFSILTNRKHVLTEPVYELIEAATGWNEMRKGWNKEEPAP